MIALQYLFNTACLYDIRLRRTKVLSVNFNKIFLLLFVATFGTVPHCHYVHPWLLLSILISIFALYLCPGALELQSPPFWLPLICVQKYLLKYTGIVWWGYTWWGPAEGVGGLLVFFLPLLPSLAERSRISSWFCARTCCRNSAVPVIGGTGYSCGELFTVFAWCWNYTGRRLTISSTRFACPYPYSSRSNFPVSVSSRWASRKLVWNAIHVFWTRGRQFQYLMESRKFPIF